MNKIPMTVSGAEKLREELQKLKTKDRPKVIQAIAEARAHGDLKENAEYHAAREQQAFIEGRIGEIEAKLSNCQVIDVKSIANSGKIIFGTTVTIIDPKSEKTFKYQIVGDDEANITENKISVSSPIARAMIGKAIDDVIEVDTPEGILEYEVLEVEHI